MRNKKDLDAVGKQISKINKEERASMEKTSKLRLNARRKKLKKLVTFKIAGMNKKDKLKAMTPNGVQKILDEAEAELKAKEEAA